MDGSPRLSRSAAKSILYPFLFFRHPRLSGCLSDCAPPAPGSARLLLAGRQGAGRGLGGGSGPRPPPPPRGPAPPGGAGGGGAGGGGGRPPHIAPQNAGYLS